MGNATVEVIEVLNEGLVKFLGQRITLFCINYIYTGRLGGVSSDCVLLTNPAIVYETGPFSTREWKDAQDLPHEIYVMRSAIESFGEVK